MRIFIAIMGLFIGFNTWADDDFTANRIDTLHYRSAAGMSQATFGISSPLQDQNIETKNGAENGTRFRSFLQGQGSYAYGITDRWLVALTLNYMFNDTESENFDSTRTSIGEQYGGFSDPTLRVNYRFLGELTGSFFGSAFLNYTPSFGANRNAVADQVNGNLLAGSTVTQAGATFYWVKGRNEWNASASAELIGNKTNEDAINEANTDFVGSYTRYFLSGTYRYHYSERFFAGLIADLNFGYSYANNYSNTPAGSTSSTSIPFVIEPELVIGWHVMPGSLIQATYGWLNYTNTTTSAFNTFKNQITEQNFTLSFSFEI